MFSVPVAATKKGSSVGNIVNDLYSSFFSPKIDGNGADLGGDGVRGTWTSRCEPNGAGVLSGRCLRSAACFVGEIRPAWLRLRTVRSSEVVAGIVG
jgi:hypothetical protein